MKVVVERVGGFAGLRRRGEIDENELSSEQRGALKEIMERPQTPTVSDPGADRFTYHVEIQDEKGTKRITLPESAIPPSLAKIATY
jgi:hypothetical protein